MELLNGTLAFAFNLTLSFMISLPWQCCHELLTLGGQVGGGTFWNSQDPSQRVWEHAPRKKLCNLIMTPAYISLPVCDSVPDAAVLQPGHRATGSGVHCPEEAL